MKLLSSLTLAGFLISIGTPLWAQTVRVRWDRGTDYSTYETYQWLDGSMADVNPQTHRVIVDAVDAQMSINGVFLEELEPDLYAVYYASAESSFSIDGGYQTDWTDSGAVKIESHTAGTLVVDLVDVEANRVVWRAIATATITQDESKNRRIVQEAMKKMFANFPPPPPKKTNQH